MDESTIDFATKTQLVDTLLACPTMRDRNTRNQIVEQLTKVRVRIPRSETDHIDVANIVNRVLDFNGGLAQLLTVLRAYEGESRHMQNVDAWYKQHTAAHDPSASNNTTQPASKTPNNPQATQRPLRIFLCHASGDKAEVRNLYEHLHLDGMAPWLDEKNLLPGQQWQQEIPQAIRDADVVIVALSHNAVNAQGYIRDEIRFALDTADKLPKNTIYIIPVKLEECDVPEQLGRWQWVHLFDDDGYERLLQALKARAQEIEAKPPVWNSGVTPPKPPKSSSWLPILTAIGVILMILVIALAARNDFMGLLGRSVTDYVNPIDGATYVYVPAGEFIMGSEDGASDESPQRKVYLDEYWIMETEVTNTQYNKFMEADGYTTENYWSPDGWSWRTENSITQPLCWDNSAFNSLQQPVVCVSWYEAVAYANWLSAEIELDFGLPTEAQWEKAARGSDGRIYPWGNQWDDSKANSSGENDGYQYPASVGSYPAGASPYDMLDMVGNVWEWTADWYDSNYYERMPTRNPTGPESGDSRVFRGGSWANNSDYVRAANRGRDAPDIRYIALGVRLVLHERREN